MLNEMMHRPIVKQEVLEFIRNKQKKLKGGLGELESYANEKGIPIIPHETVVFLEFLLRQIQPKNVLEIGTAIGFSASLMAQFVGDDGKVTTIDRFETMIQRAKQNFEKLEVSDRVELLEGQAVDILPKLTGPYDFIFMDCAKAKYIEFLPDCLRVLEKGGILAIDDVFQGGTVFDEEETIERRNRKIHRKLKELLEVLTTHPDISSTFLPLGDGLVLISKLKEVVIL